MINLVFLLNFASHLYMNYLYMNYACVDARKNNLGISFTCFDENLSNKPALC